MFILSGQLHLQIFYYKGFLSGNKPAVSERQQKTGGVLPGFPFRGTACANAYSCEMIPSSRTDCLSSFLQVYAACVFLLLAC
jgi:hypothetical protein